jgi:hypothetical protein
MQKVIWRMAVKQVYSDGNASRCPAMSNDNRLKLLHTEPAA